MPHSPFESIESAHAYIRLLEAQVATVKESIAEDLVRVTAEGPVRHVDALRLVDYKLHQLERHLATSGTILNDLRALRRLLLGEREPVPPITPSLLQSK